MDSDVDLGFDSDIFSSHKHIILFSFVSKFYVLRSIFPVIYSCHDNYSLTLQQLTDNSD